jgi:hypothetical protein
MVAIGALDSQARPESTFHPSSEYTDRRRKPLVFKRQLDPEPES